MSFRKRLYRLMHSHLLIYPLFVYLLSTTCLLTESADATPLIALREAQNCEGCHNPGRSQRPFLERRCTLDCQGCHVDPAGAGPRNEWGYYYSQDQASMVNFFKPIDPLKDESRWDGHLDARIIQWDKAGGQRQTFPMALETSMRLRPFKDYLHLTYQALMLGRIEDDMFRVVREGDRRFREKYSLMIDALPLNTYVRAYRGSPMYGLRRPNHTLWIRQRIGFDQMATTEAIELGGTPNVPFFRVSLMQGDPYVSRDLRQKGHSYHGGVRGVTLGWHLNASGWSTESEYHKIDMQAVGGGFNAFQVLLYTERNWRQVSAKEHSAAPETLSIHPGSTISETTLAYAGIRGVMFGSVWEELQDPSRQSKRSSYFLDLHPFPYLQLELWRRYETGSRRFEDTLAIMHFYADF
ncbi:MAG: hypothetical protein ACOH5I_07395 [Oligoflexus sp.]